MAAGRIAANKGELPLIPVVLLAERGAPAGWRIQKLPGSWLEGEYPFPYPETALIPGNRCVTAVVRGGRSGLGIFQHRPGRALERSCGCRASGGRFQNVRRSAVGWKGILYL